MTLLEAGYAARSAHDVGRILTGPPMAATPVEYLTPAVEDRAVQILTALAERGRHRAPSLPDVLIAAIAERSGLTILPVDEDFELIAEVTSQPLERLVMTDE